MGPIAYTWQSCQDRCTSWWNSGSVHCSKVGSTRVCVDKRKIKRSGLSVHITSAVTTRVSILEHSTRPWTDNSFRDSFRSISSSILQNIGETPGLATWLVLKVATQICEFLRGLP
jgi:hypothetical protein